MSPSLDRTANQIWKALLKSGEASVSQLVRKLDQETTLVYRALSRLASQDKIAYRTRGNQTFIIKRETGGRQLCLGDSLQLI
jgi:predicted transcriptional regulator